MESLYAVCNSQLQHVRTRGHRGAPRVGSNTCSSVGAVAASNRDRAQVMHPRAVWVDHSGAWRGRHAWTLGILLDWRRTPHGWEGLTLYAYGGGELPWSAHLSWVRAAYLRPIRAPDP